MLYSGNENTQKKHLYPRFWHILQWICRLHWYFRRRIEKIR